jgi:hypothetical protein
LSLHQGGLRTVESDNQITVTTVTLTPENVEVEAKRFAMRAGGLLLLAMADKGLTEKQLADMLSVPNRQIRSLLMGERWKDYLPLAALALALDARMDMRLTTK